MRATCSAFPYTCKSDMPHLLGHYVTRLTRHLAESMNFMGRTKLDFHRSTLFCCWWLFVFFFNLGLNDNAEFYCRFSVLLTNR